jgi:hypothetical protein
VRARLPWLLIAAWAALTAGGAVLYAVRGEWLDVLISPALAVFAATGTLLALRRPGNAVGWLLLAAALLISFSSVLQGLSIATEGDGDPSLLSRMLAWLDGVLFYAWIWLVAVMVPLLFPAGRLPSRRWRPFAWLAAAVVAACAVGEAFGSPTLDWDGDSAVANPLRAPGAAGDVLEALGAFGGGLFLAVFAGALASLAIRLRRAHGVERQQLKWVAFALALLVVGLTAAAAGEAMRLDAIGNAGWSLFLVSLILGLPVAIGVAVLRHRLYDIDVVIRRTLVYAALVATLLGAYLAIVLLSGLALGDSDLAIAAATLAVAGLARPALARIRAAVDRRFYRSRYDAERTLEAFGTRLRDELDLETLGADLGRVVHETLQPAHVSVWLRSGR